MNHPSNEQWMSYCYNELPRNECVELAAHLAACSVCTAKLKEWQQARSDLNAFKDVSIPRATAYRFTAVPLKWGAAFAIVCSALVLGGFSASHQRSRGLNPVVEAELKAQIRAEFTQVLQKEINNVRATASTESEERTKELLKVFAVEMRAQQKKDLQGIYTAIDKIDLQRASDFVALKTELDALAINADAQLRTTERHLLELATSAQTTVSHEE